MTNVFISDTKKGVKLAVEEIFANLEKDNIILESSGLSPIQFGPAPIPVQQPQAGGSTAPVQELSEANQQPQI